MKVARTVRTGRNPRGQTRNGEEDKTITSIDTIADINVAYGTSVDQLNLPETVKVTLDDESTTNLNVEWDTTNYDGNVAETYELTGTITVTEGIVNTSDLKASVNVIVAENPNKVIGSHTVEIGDTEVPNFARDINGTITVTSSVVDENGKVTDNTTINALNAQAPGEGGTEGVGYTGYNISFTPEEDKVAKNIVVYKDDVKVETATIDEDNFIKVYVAIADKNEEIWTVRKEKVEWKFEWLDESENVIGRTFFTTNVVLGQ